MKVSRRRGQVRLRLDPVEAQVLTAVLTEVADAIGTDALAVDDPVRMRLYPAAYGDDDAATSEFRDLTESALRSEREARARACVDELGIDSSATTASGAELTLDDAAGTRWITALNDVRLALGTRLGITEDDPADDPQAPDFQQRALYYWLTALQDSLVQSLMD